MMRDFLRWAFGIDSPDWVVVFVITTLVVGSMAWVVLAMVFQSIAMAVAPFVLGAFLAWQEYQRSRDQ